MYLYNCPICGNMDNYNISNYIDNEFPYIYIY